MTKARLLRSSCAWVAIGALVLQAPLACAAEAPLVEIGKPTSDIVARYASKPATMQMAHAAKLALVKQKVKYVFVLFQENRSFDQHFGTFPGVDGLFSQSPANTPGFAQKIVNTDGTVGIVTPFLIPQTVTVTGTTTSVPLYPADTDSVDHSHRGIDNSLDLNSAGTSRNDRYALNEEGLTTSHGQIVSLATGLPATTNPTLAQKQKGELVMSHLDCDTIPFLWQYADRFTLMDNFHQTIIGPSTPNAIAMIAGQSGDTQWALHPSEAASNTGSPVVQKSGGEPVTADPGPFAGSNLDQAPVKPPYSPDDVSPASPTLNQTYAALPLSFMGPSIQQTIASDENPALDLLDVQDDIATIASKNLKTVPWGWYQQGYDHEATDGGGPASHTDYITHHNGPQYFGYVGDNPKVASNLHGLGDFFADMAAGGLPARGGVFYVRGGYGNQDGMVPTDPDTTVQTNFAGNDDHPGYSDAQISEALVAQEVNAIASSKYWKDSAIIITYDETDGLYDHQAITPRTRDSFGFPLDGGPRIPAIVISPYSVAHGISHEYSEHSSVIKFIDELFSMVPLGDLPDEARGRALGKAEFGEDNLGPADTLPGMGDLLTAFDDARLSGSAAPLPAEYAMIPAADVTALPPYGGQGCYTLNIVPTDYVNGKLIDPPPVDFNPRPSTTPGTPTSGNWTP
jgi:phospholipase C